MTASPPPWLERVAGLSDRPLDDLPEWFRLFAPPPAPPRRSAVLMLFGSAGQGRGEDVVFTERSRDLRSHAGQVSFPGGGHDAADVGLVATALRETQEEVGVDPGTVEVVRELPTIYMSFTGHAITPVLGWWRQPHQIGIVDEREVARVARIPLDDLVEPSARFTVYHPAGYSGPGFEADGMFIWGFTAMLLATVLDVAGLSKPWNAQVRREIPDHVASAWMRGRV